MRNIAEENKKKWNEAKYKWKNGKFRNIDLYHRSPEHTMHRKTEEISGKKACLSIR